MICRCVTTEVSVSVSLAGCLLTVTQWMKLSILFLLVRSIRRCSLEESLSISHCCILIKVVFVLHSCRSNCCHCIGGYSCGRGCHLWCGGVHVEKTTKPRAAYVSTFYPTSLFFCCCYCCFFWSCLQSLDLHIECFFLKQCTDAEEAARLHQLCSS